VQASDRQAVEATRALPTPFGATIPARDYALTVNTSRFTVVTPGAGLAVLVETFLPGEFHATLNGAPVSYFRVNHAFKGVVIPAAGKWTVEFRHRPRQWPLSLALAGFGVVMLVGMSLALRRE
jgi:hypothetical protein